MQLAGLFTAGIRSGSRPRMVALVVAATLAASALGAGSGGAAAGLPDRVRNADPGITKNEIVLGSPDVLSGTAANIVKGIPVSRAAYYEEVNANGGINGRKIKDASEDGGTIDPVLAQSAVSKLKDEAFALIASDGTLYGPLAARVKIPVFYAFGTQEAGLKNKYGFPLGTYHKYQAEKLLPDYLLNELDAKGKKIAVTYEAEGFLSEANKAFVKAAKKKGLDVVIDQPLDPLQPSCAQEVANIAAKKPDIVIPFTLGSSVCLFREAKSQGLETSWAGVGGTWGIDLFLTLVAPYLDGATIFGLNGAFDSPCAKEYQDIMRRRRPDQPQLLTDVPSYNSYLAVRLTVKLIEKAGKNVTRESLIKKLSKVKNFDDGCLPPVTYGPGNKRQGAVSVALWEAKGNAWTTVDPEYHTKF